MISLATVTTKRKFVLRKKEPWQRKRRRYLYPIAQHFIHKLILPHLHFVPPIRIKGGLALVERTQTTKDFSQRCEDNQNQQTSAWHVVKQDIGEQTAQTSKHHPPLGNLKTSKEKQTDKLSFVNNNFIDHSTSFSPTICNPSVSVKGRLKKSFKYWESIGANENILDVVRQGYKLPFIETPKSANFKNNLSALKEADFVSKSIETLLDSGSIIETSYFPKVVNPLSVSTQANGKKRLILDLRYINSHLYSDYIKFDDWKSLENYISQNCYSGYHHVDIFEEHQTYLGFSWIIEGIERYFVFTVLPFGLSSAPYIFTKVIRPLVAFWHSKGIKIYVKKRRALAPSNTVRMNHQLTTCSGVQHMFYGVSSGFCLLIIHEEEYFNFLLLICVSKHIPAEKSPYMPLQLDKKGVSER